jgi:hypothetical protein
MRLFPSDVNLFNLRQRSLLRANLLVLGSLLAAFLISGFTPIVPLIRATLWQVLPMAGALLGMAETARCIRPRWSMYHAAVVLYLYMDLLVLTLLAVLLFYPYMHK